MKRTVLLLLAVCILLSALAGCGEEPSGEAPPQTTETTQSTLTEPTQAEETAPDTATAELVITEVMADNRLLTLGHEYDWVELYNPGENPVSLEGFFLTDALDAEGLSLAGMTVDAEGYLAVTLSDNASFQLSEAGETVYLTCRGQVVSELAFSVSENGKSWGADGILEYATPGFANTESGYLEYLEDLELPELIISEVITSNSAYWRVGQEYYDLVEIKNSSDQAVNLADYYLTNSWESTKRYHFPDVTLEPGAFFVVYCSGNSDLGTNHAPFGVSADGAAVYLARQGKFIDALAVPGDLKTNESYGRCGKVPMYLTTVTLNEENSEGYLNGVAVPQASLESGLYDEAVSVALTGEGTIYYTLDGSRPTTSSSVYKNPITVTGVTTIRAFCVSEGRKSGLTAYTYVVGREHDLPIVTVAIPQVCLTGGNGVLNHIEANFEYEAVLTLIEEGEEKFSVPVGFRLHGNDSRKGAKQNFQLRFRSEYGASKLKYPLFDSRDIDEFDSLLLKGGSEDWNRAMLRDELSTALADGTTALYCQAMKPVVLYLGGRYWGIYYLRERFSDEYVASHMDVSPESVDILFSSAGYTQVGDNKDFQALKGYASIHNMSTNEAYAYLCEQIDVNSLMDWYIFRTYLADTDIANIRRCRSSEGDGKWHWMLFDMDWGFYNRPLTAVLDLYGGDNLLIHAVLQSEAGQDAFLKRYAYIMKTVLNEQYINSVLDSIVSQIESEMPRDRERWDKTVSEWEREVESIRKFVKDDARIKRIVSDLQIYFSLSSAEMEYYFGDLDY